MNGIRSLYFPKSDAQHMLEPTDDTPIFAAMVKQYNHKVDRRIAKKKVTTKLRAVMSFLRRDRVYFGNAKVRN